MHPYGQLTVYLNIEPMIKTLAFCFEKKHKDHIHDQIDPFYYWVQGHEEFSPQNNMLVLVVLKVRY